MPDRIVRAGILTSEGVNTLSSAGEVFYRRLMSVVDDHGRYDGRTAILRAVLYPLQLAKVSEPDIGKWILETEEAALVRQYTVGGKPYLEIVKFGQKIRSKSKWPDPPTSADSCQQPPANVPVVVVVSEVVCEAGAEAPKPPTRRKAKTLLPPNFGLSERVIDWAKAKGYSRLQEHLDAFRLKAVANGYAYADWDAAFMNAIASDWAGLRKGPQAQPTAHSVERAQAQLAQQRAAAEQAAPMPEHLRPRKAVSH
jgi:hypothetical protein